MSEKLKIAEPPFRHGQAFVLFSSGFRPFFLAAGILASLSVPLWLTMYYGLVVLPALDNPVAWHVHEMLFGYLGAALAGFLLTALPNWTGRAPIVGAKLTGLFLLWLVGRLAMFIPASSTTSITLAILFPVALTAVVWREVLACKNYRNLPVCVLISIFALGQIVFWLGYEGTGPRLGFAAAATLLMLIGGRITPSFTRSWIDKLGKDGQPAPFGVVDKVSLLAGVLAMACWIVAPQQAATGVIFAIAAGLNTLRLGRWCGHSTVSEPLLLALHVGYGWLCVSFAIFSLSILAPRLATEQQALHALGAGAIGQMTLVVMARASLGHTGRALRSDVATALAFLLVFLGAVLRISAGWFPQTPLVMQTSAVLWSGGFAIFVVRYFPIHCFGPREPDWSCEGHCHVNLRR